MERNMAGGSSSSRYATAIEENEKKSDRNQQEISVTQRYLRVSLATNTVQKCSVASTPLNVRQ
jgi:hypothetical protein